MTRPRHPRNPDAVDRAVLAHDADVSPRDALRIVVKWNHAGERYNGPTRPVRVSPWEEGVRP